MPRRATRPPPLLAEFDDEEREAVLSANRAFYRAFSERDCRGDGPDLGADRRRGLPASRPGAARYDRAEIMASWRAILRHPEAPRVRCVDEWVVGRPGLAIVVCREILPEGQLMATNTFARLSERLAHDRPSFGAGAGDRDRADDGGAGVGTDARPAQAALACCRHCARSKLRAEVARR